MNKQEHMRNLIENWSQAEYWLTYHKVVLHDAFSVVYDIAQALEYKCSHNEDDGITEIWIQGTEDYVLSLVEIWVYSNNHIISVGNWVNQ